MLECFWPHRLQPARLPCPSPTLGACSNSCPSSWQCHPNISFSVFPLSSFLQSFPASGSFPMSQFFSSGGVYSLRSLYSKNMFYIYNMRKCAYDTYLKRLLRLQVIYWLIFNLSGKWNKIIYFKFLISGERCKWILYWWFHVSFHWTSEADRCKLISVSHAPAYTKYFSLKEEHSVKKCPYLKLYLILHSFSPKVALESNSSHQTAGQLMS